MKAFLFIIFFLLICFYSTDARRGGGGRFSISKYSSSRYSYSSSYRYSTSYRSYRSYYRRYSSRYAYRSRYSSVYRSSVRVSSAGMGGLISNKQALLLAGSVYIAYRVQPRVFTSRGSLYAGAVANYAICSGAVRWDPLLNKSSYAYEDDLYLNASSTTASPLNTTMPTTLNSVLSTGVVNATVATVSGAAGATSSPTGRYVIYDYFLCPSDLFNSAFDPEDTYCCGPPGAQMCCSSEDFEEQLEQAGTVGIIVGIFFGIAFLVMMCGCPIYLMRDSHRRRLSCRSCRRKCSSCIRSSSSSSSRNNNSNQDSTARPEVTFHRIAKADEDEPQVMVSSQQPPYPLYPGGANYDNQPEYPLYPQQPTAPQEPMLPPPSHPPPTYEEANK